MDDDHDKPVTTDDRIRAVHKRLERIENYLIWIMIFLAALLGRQFLPWF